MSISLTTGLRRADFFGVGQRPECIGVLEISYLFRGRYEDSDLF